MREYVGSFGVDSGQVMIGDPCYLTQWVDEMSKGEEFNGKLEKPYPYTYNGACSATIAQSAGVLGEMGHNEGHAIAVSTGYGDGCYPVYIEKNHEGRVKSITIEFMTDEVEDDEDDE